jgi:hypothetical protein
MVLRTANDRNNITALTENDPLYLSFANSEPSVRGPLQVCTGCAIYAQPVILTEEKCLSQFPLVDQTLTGIGGWIMAEDVIAALRAEIAGLEKQLGTRRRALAILVGTTPKVKAAPKARPAPAPARAGKPPAKPLAVRIQEYLAANKEQKFTPAQLASALQKRDKTVRRDNVQRRLSDLAKAKKVKRENGHYSML